MATEHDIENGRLPSSELLSSSASRTATFATADQINKYGHRGVYVFAKINSADSSATFSLTIQGKLPGGGSSDYINLLAGSSFAPSSSGQFRTALLFPDGNATAAGGIDDRASAPLTRTWRVRPVHGTTRAIDYSIRAVRLF